MGKILAGLILILLGSSSTVFAQSSLSKCKGNDSSKWSNCFGSERIKDKIETDTNRTYEGLGIEVEMESGVVKIISPMDNTPAFRSGVKPGDYIVQINGDQVQGKTLMEVVNLMRGPAGTPIEITIIRKGENEPVVLKIVREIIQVKSIAAKSYTTYLGEYKNGKYHGDGTYTWETGAKYVGRFKNGKYHGQGTYTFEDGAKYVGQFKNGKYHGQGTYTGADGRKYDGGWKDDSFNGQGIFIYTDEKIEEGIWKYGKLVKPE